MRDHASAQTATCLSPVEELDNRAGQLCILCLHLCLPHASTELDGKAVLLYTKRAAAYISMRQQANAIKDLNTALEIDATHIPACLARGKVQRQMCNLNGARIALGITHSRTCTQRRCTPGHAVCTRPHVDMPCSCTQRIAGVTSQLMHAATPILHQLT